MKNGLVWAALAYGLTYCADLYGTSTTGTVLAAIGVVSCFLILDLTHSWRYR